MDGEQDENNQSETESVEEYILCKPCYLKEQYPREDVEEQ